MLSFRFSSIGALCAAILLVSMIAFADSNSSKSPPPAPQPTISAIPNPSELTPEEISSYQAQYDSLAADSTLQKMAVGWGVDGTIVLSVLVALLIFIILVRIL